LRGLSPAMSPETGMTDAAGTFLAKLIAGQSVMQEAVLRGFVATCGHIQYRDVTSERHVRWRERHLSRCICEIPGCAAGPGAPLVFDHCHEHGWVRGVVCCGHNYRLGQVDAVLAIDGAVVDLAATAYARHLANCPGCSGTLAQTATTPAPWEYEPWVPKPAGRPIDPAAKVRHPEKRTVHVRLTEKRTWCGRSADGMIPVSKHRADAMCASCTKSATRPEDAPAQRQPTGRLRQAALF
jgi:hypothetical protein